MSRIGVYLLLLAIGVQSATLLSQRVFVADPVELAHIYVINDVEVDKPTGRLSLDSAADLSHSCVATTDFTWHVFLYPTSLCLAHRVGAYLQRGPPSLI